MILIVSSSLNADSNSRILAREAQRVLAQDGESVTWLDLRDHPLPLCDGGSAYGHPAVRPVLALLQQARAIIIATPIYNYDGTAALKNVIELTGAAWDGKVVAFLCAAGGMGSYMSIMSLANSLMLDFRSIIVPRFVYATTEAFTEGRISDSEQIRRVAELARTTTKMAGLLSAA